MVNSHQRMKLQSNNETTSTIFAARRFLQWRIPGMTAMIAVVVALVQPRHQNSYRLWTARDSCASVVHLWKHPATLWRFSHKEIQTTRTSLKLCTLCRSLQYSFWKKRVQHYDDFQGLEETALQGCWCFQTVSSWRFSMEDHDCPPIGADPTRIRFPRLFMWFAENTSTKSGYLDHLRKVGMCLCQYALTWYFIDFIPDYFEHLFNPLAPACETDPSSEASFRLVGDWLETCNLHLQCYQGSGIKLQIIFKDYT